MRYVRMIGSVLVPLVLLVLAGCGSGSSGGASTSPFGNTGGSSGTIFGNISTLSGKTGISLTTDVARVDVNNGQVLATAKVINNGVAVANAPVAFSIVAPTNGPATIEAGLSTVNTDSNGMAITRITTGNSQTTTNVIIRATTTIASQTATVYASFQIVRGAGIIAFPGSPMTNEKTVDSGFAAWIFFQQIPFRVTDSNGNPRVGVPVTLSVYSHASNASTPSVIDIDYLQSPVTEPSQQTITSDSAGQGVFNVSVTVAAPGPGRNVVDSIVFKAVTNDPIPVVAYAGLTTNLIENPVPVTITPASASFTATDVVGATISFTIAGGTAPYSVTSSNPARVSVVKQSDGVTAVATLQDASLWTGSVSISATDQRGQTATATVLRQ